MSSIQDTVTIQAPVSRVYTALTTQAGYRGWWNAAGEVDETTGGEARLKFVKDGQPVNMTFRIDALRPNESVRWTCTAHDVPDWVGTWLAWSLAQKGDRTVVTFEHGGWKGDAPDVVAQGWKHFLGSLRSFVETGTGQPW